MEEIVLNYLGWNGKMISGSKSGYRDNHPDNLVVFNANVCVGLEKVWYGDLDITLSKDTLINLSKELGDVVFVLYEMDGRFGYESDPKIDNYVVKFNPDGTYVIHDRLKDNYSL
jgi:hypothetical protein